MKHVAVAVSGGIDSLMAAYLLKNQGLPVTGIHFITGYESIRSGCQGEALADDSFPEEAENSLEAVFGKLDIAVHVIDLSDEFKERVVNYFIKTYKAGKTPNPCLVCNPAIKFGTILSHAQKLGACALATGHYARKVQDHKGLYHLLKGIDAGKDQSYFLAFLNQDQLSHALFPLGTMTKNEVKALSAEKGLKPITGCESQDVCFIKSKSCAAFLDDMLSAKPGPIRTVSGKIIGEHKGLHLFTVGQRRGINCPASEPYYVVRLDLEKNTLVVGFKDDLYKRSCCVENINWIQGPPEDSLRVRTRLRYRHEAASSTLYLIDDKTATVRFERPQAAVTPGQGAVFYEGDEIVGGGWIA